MKLPRTNILAYKLPFGTSQQTKPNAWRLMHALGVSAEEIDMTPAYRQMLADIRHQFAEGKKQYDVTFENVQAGARTSLLFRLANQYNGMVLGTGKRSALPNGPKASLGGPLSPRGDWRAPSDGSAIIWLAELEAAVVLGKA